MPLRIDYELDSVRLRLADLSGRAPTLWRYRELLPLEEGDEVSLAEGFTPLLRVEDGVWVKDESRNPTGSFKARGMALAVSMARHLGATALQAPSAGNAAGALAAYGARAGLPVTVAMPEDTPAGCFAECRSTAQPSTPWRARLQTPAPTCESTRSRARWMYRPCASRGESRARRPWRSSSSSSFKGAVPDVVLYPTGGGTGLIGMWKAFDEMERLGWIPAGRRPRFVSVQAAGCAPVVRAFLAGSERTEPWIDPKTRAWGLRVPAPLGGFLCLRALRETQGTAVAVEDVAIERATAELAARSGLDVCPEGGAAWAALALLRMSGFVRPDDTVVVFNTGAGGKYR